MNKSGKEGPQEEWGEGRGLQRRRNCVFRRPLVLSRYDNHSTVLLRCFIPLHSYV